MSLPYVKKYTDIISSCAIVAPAKKGSALTLKKITSFHQLIEEFGEESKKYPLVSMAKILFMNNVKTIYCIAPSINEEPLAENYTKAFEILNKAADFYSVICDSSDTDVIKNLTKIISSPFSRPKLAFAPISSDNEPKNVLSEIASSKLIVTDIKTYQSSNNFKASAILTAAALGAIVSNFTNLSSDLSSLPILGLELKDKSLDSCSLNSASSLGISTVRRLHSNLETYKIVPSLPISKSNPNHISHRLILDITTMAIMDLINNIKSSSSFNLLSCQSLSTQIILLLAEQKELGLISDFLIPEINISSSINIKISIKPVSILPIDYICQEISI